MERKRDIIEMMDDGGKWRMGRRNGDDKGAESEISCLEAGELALAGSPTV